MVSRILEGGQVMGRVDWVNIAVKYIKCINIVHNILKQCRI